MDKIEDLQLQLEQERLARIEAEAELNQRNLSLLQMNQELTELATNVAQREELFRLIFETAVDGIITLDDQGHIDAINQAARTMFGYSTGEVAGKPLSNFLDSTQCDFYTALTTSLDTAAPDTAYHETVGRRKDGSPLPIEVALSEFQFGEQRTLILMVRDLTDRKQAQKEQKMMEVQLRQAQKLESIGQLAAGIAHEINTPTQFVSDNTCFLRDAFKDLLVLTTVRNELISSAQKGPVPLQLLAREQEMAEEIDLEYLLKEIPIAIAQSQNGLKRISKIVSAMKVFSYSGAEEKTAIDINNAIRSTIEVSRNEWKYIAEMKQQLAPELPLVPLLPGEFNQVILNCIINAAHAIADTQEDDSKEKGAITVSTRQDGDWVEISISDTGTGIPEAIRSKIFDPFFTTKEVGKGTGQGLAIVYSVITDKHDGKVSVKSEMGSGTTFNLRLPIANATKNREAK